MNSTMYYAVECAAHETQRDYDLALMACQLATIAEDWDEQTDEIKSSSLYRYARLLRGDKYYKEAVEHFTLSIEIQEKIEPLDKVKLGRRYAEMAGALFELEEYEKGSKALDTVLEDSYLFSLSEQYYLSLLCYLYSTEIKNKEKIEIYLFNIELMGHEPDDFKKYLDK